MFDWCLSRRIKSLSSCVHPLPSVLILSAVLTKANNVALNITVPSLFRGMFIDTRRFMRWNTQPWEHELTQNAEWQMMENIKRKSKFLWGKWQLLTHRVWWKTIWTLISFQRRYADVFSTCEICLSHFRRGCENHGDFLFFFKFNIHRK